MRSGFRWSVSGAVRCSGVHRIFVDDPDILRRVRELENTDSDAQRTDAKGSPSRGTRRAARALEHVFRPPVVGRQARQRDGEQLKHAKDKDRGFLGGLCHGEDFKLY